MSDEPDRELLAEGTLISHLVELRQRLLKAVVAIAIVFAPCAWFANDLFTIIATPLIQKMPAGSSMIATSLISPFMAPLKLSLFIGLFIAKRFSRLYRPGATNAQIWYSTIGIDANSAT